MIKIIKLDPSSESYIYSKSTNNKISKLDYNNNDLMIHISDKDLGELTFSMEDVCKQYGGLYYIEHNNDKLLLDDGYYDVLCRAGYLVLGDYDKAFLNKEEGQEILKKIQQDVSEGILKMVDDYLPENMFLQDSTDSSITINSLYYSYSIYIEPITSIIAENQKRKLNDLPYYPYQKDMDKYGTFYVRSFIKLLPTVKYEKEIIDNGISKYTEMNDLVRNFIITINNLDPKNNYHYEPVTIKKMIIK